MVEVKTLDREYLATHPKGNEKASVTFAGDVPAALNIAANPDGTAPRMALTVEASTYLHIVQALDALRRDKAEQFQWELLEQVTTEEDVTVINSAEDATALLRGRANEVVVPFRTLKVEMAIEETGAFGQTSSDVVFTLVAPNLTAGIALALNSADPSMLAQTMIALSPENGEDGDEVLVVS